MEWIYSNNEDNSCRFTLGVLGSNPLLCVGVNPSTATPNNLDNTLRSVSRIAKANGYDSWIMINLYPQRATNPNDMHKKLDHNLLRDNLRYIKDILDNYPNLDIWVAWGTLIEKRSFLKTCLVELVEVSSDYKCRWITYGKRSKKGHPHHPLYLRTDSSEHPFDVHAYLDSL